MTTTKRKPSSPQQALDVTEGSPRPTSRSHTSIWDRPGFLVRRLHQIHVAMFLEAMEGENVTPIQYGLLSILVDRPGLDQLSVAEELGIDRANVGDILNRLEQRKLLTRVIDPSDKRRKICLPTRDGVAFVQAYHENMRHAQERLLDPLDPDEGKLFIALLHRLVAANNDVGRAPLKPSKGRFADEG